MSFITFIPLVTALLSSQDATGKLFERREDGSVRLFDGRVVPPLPRLLGVRAQYELRLEWLVSKHAQLLPMMRKYGVAMWIVTSHEFHPDAVFEYIAPDLYYTGRLDIHASSIRVTRGSPGSRYWRPTENYQRFFEPLPVPRPTEASIYQRYGPRRSSTWVVDAVRTAGRAHRFLSEALGAGPAAASYRPVIEDSIPAFLKSSNYWRFG